jgi:hypothetical protein
MAQLDTSKTEVEPTRQPILVRPEGFSGIRIAKLGRVGFSKVEGRLVNLFPSNKRALRQLVVTLERRRRDAQQQTYKHLINITSFL